MQFQMQQYILNQAKTITWGSRWGLQPGAAVLSQSKSIEESIERIAKHTLRSTVASFTNKANIFLGVYLALSKPSLLNRHTNGVVVAAANSRQ